MDSREVRKVAKQYGLAVKKEIGAAKEIILFGSYAKGNEKPESDIDIAIVFNSLNFDLLDTYKILYKLRRNFDIRIEPIILSQNEDPAGFIAEVKKYGIPLL